MEEQHNEHIQSSSGRSGTSGPPEAAVIGLGRFGRFWAGILANEYTVVGTSRRRITSIPAGVTQVPLEEALRAPLVFLTVAISAMPQVLERIGPYLTSDTTVVDTCSVKVFPVRQMEALLPGEVDIIACHPMFGPDSARERTDRLPVIMWPVRDRNGRYGPLTAAFTRLGMRVVEMAPEDHDREAAFTQGVTHLVGRLLSAMQLHPSEIGTLGYKRLLQVMDQTCNDPLELFRDLQRYNPSTREMRRCFSDALAQVEKLLEDQSDPSELS